MHAFKKKWPVITACRNDPVLPYAGGSGWIRMGERVIQGVWVGGEGVRGGWGGGGVGWGGG